MDEVGAGQDGENVVVLDYLPHGHTDDDRPQYKKSALVQAIDRESFTLYELTLTQEADVAIGDTVSVTQGADWIDTIDTIPFANLSTSARSELEHAIGELFEQDETRFVDFFNEAGAISLRLHQFNLLPGIGETLRDEIIEARRQEPFQQLDDLESRIDGIHDIREILYDRIMAELRKDDIKYALFVGSEKADR